MKVEVKNFISNIFYTISSNLLSIIISSLVILIIPKLIGVEEYGYWQLYLLYSSYVGIAHLGIPDGIFLRYGGEKYDDLNKKLFSSQYVIFFVFQLFLSISGLIIISFLPIGSERIFILNMMCYCLILTNFRRIILLTLQATYRIRDYSAITIIDRLSYIVIVIALLLMGYRDYRGMIVSDLIGKGISIIYGIYFCKEIFLSVPVRFIDGIKETIENFNVGSKLLIANITSTLIIGVVRFGVEIGWSIETFGKVSLTLSVSNLLMVFITAIGAVLYPLLRRTPDDNLSHTYSMISNLLMPVLLLIVLASYPLDFILSKWLPQYQEGLQYLNILFPLIIFEGKMNLLTNTFLKSLRKEKELLKINLITLFLSVFLTFISTIILSNLDLVIYGILIVLGFRALYADYNLKNFLNIPIQYDAIMEVILVLIFVLSSMFLSSLQSIFLYLVFYFGYLFLNRNKINNSFRKLKGIIK